MATAIDGRVTDFLITHNFLVDHILNLEDFKRSINKVDPGLFLIRSSSMLVEVSPVKRTAYSLITVPMREEIALYISPLYSITNLGWKERGIHYKLFLPQSYYYVSKSNKVWVSVPDATECLISLIF